MEKIDLNKLAEDVEPLEDDKDDYLVEALNRAVLSKQIGLNSLQGLEMLQLTFQNYFSLVS